MNKGKLFVLSAPSGTGKTTILKTLLKNNPKWKFSVSATNREPRDGEIDGKDYIYMSYEKCCLTLMSKVVFRLWKNSQMKPFVFLLNLLVMK